MSQKELRMHTRNRIIGKRSLIFWCVFALTTTQIHEINAIFGGRLFYFIAGHIGGLYTAHKHMLKAQENKESVPLKKDFLRFSTSVVREYPLIKDIIESPVLETLSKVIAKRIMEDIKKSTNEERNK